MMIASMTVIQKLVYKSARNTKEMRRKKWILSQIAGLKKLMNLEVSANFLDLVSTQA
jgi:hypothetical protein